MKLMPMKLMLLRCVLLILLSATTHYSVAATASWDNFVASNPKEADTMEQRLRYENKQNNNPFLISFYKPNYLLPFYYTPTRYIDHAIYSQAIPGQQKLDNMEVKFQISLKVPIWHNLLGKQNTLFAAYTQQSNWQAYNHSPFFRETNYEPELFLSSKIDLRLINNWRAKLVNMGLVHQSNGRGGDFERSWNRAYVDVTLANQNWMVNVKPWYIIPDSSLKKHNPDLVNYLGHGQVIATYQYGEHSFSIEARNNLESGFKRGSVQLTWSIPLTKKIKGYVQTFSGYGQSLIDYNQYANSAGIGIALNDWI